MKIIVQTWNRTSVIKKIICGLLLGILLALTVPQFTILSLPGELFVSALKAIAPLLVLFVVTGALSSQQEGAQSNIKRIIILYVLGTFLAGCVAVIANFLFPVTIALTETSSTSAAPSGVQEVINSLLMSLVANPIDALANANYLGILGWAILLGIALRKAGDGTKNAVSHISDAFSQIVRWIIGFAPFGVMGLVFTTISQQGLASLLSYGQLILLLVGSMAFVALVVNPIVTFIAIRRNPFPLVFKCLKDSGLTAFFTRSSAANIPVNLKLCEELGLNRDSYAVSIPLGSTINMGGAAITISTLTLTAVHTLGIAVDIPTALILCILSAVSACGASGVAGGSLLLVPLACSLFGISNDIAMQVVGVGFIVGVIQDSCETAVNSSTDVLYTAIAELSQRRKEKII